tara:strand:+ start:458 stop:802 length:345 start_codon:yes stop_codon:yes gene_type:complete
MNRTTKYSKEQDSPYQSTQLFPSLPITGWKLQDKNSNMCSNANPRAYILHNEKQGKNLSKIKLLLDILIRGQRAENASPPTLLNGKGSKQRVKWSKEFEKNYKEIFKKKDRSKK